MEYVESADANLIKSSSKYSLVEYEEKTIDSRDKDAENENVSNLARSHTHSRSSTQLRNILNALLPPIKVASDGYKQVSVAKPTRGSVVQLQTAWDEQLQLRAARSSGICAIREELNQQAFNEIIRQITIELPERGLLALRVRDESKMTIQTYQTLYQSSLAFGMRKSIQSQNEIQTLQDEIAQDEQQKAELNQKVKQLQIQKQNLERNFSEQNQIDQKQQNQEIDFLKHQKDAVQNYLKSEFGK
eukprot:CAMPEP_0202691442 /NCGR_PEP_ID=MMETSP1385-20130828/6159_1 /ASSEMBLY_ACC=CAM_ASM_000861 /TAXON_ID=933848 /ORGANISM="Elphidium margaritaceum" /LENGTH=244 /DNA_ID=CAMNT_0049346847 /DNA_START=93 /DNA_END=827 /DNA_ORIENTATION=+